MSYFFDRAGQSIDMMDWVASMKNPANKRVAEDTVSGYWVSTVWLGMDYSLGDGPPLIFETMVFPQKEGETNWYDEYCERYATEEEALAGHADVVAKLKAGTLFGTKANG
jgi:hypothetical protein